MLPATQSVKLLADTSGEPVLPGTAVLRMETTARRTGTFDGAWWPRTRDLKSQLSALLIALTARLGPIARVGLDASDWDGAPGHLFVDGHMVRIDWSAVGDHTMNDVCAERILAATGITGAGPSDVPQSSPGRAGPT